MDVAFNKIVTFFLLARNLDYRICDIWVHCFYWLVVGELRDWADSFDVSVSILRWISQNMYNKLG